MAKNIIRYIDLSKFVYKEKEPNKIDWTKSVGITTEFNYDGIIGTITILKSDPKNNTCYARFSFNGYTVDKNVRTHSIRTCSFGKALQLPIAITHPYLLQYFINQEDAYKYTAYSTQTVQMQCPICGYKKERKICYLTSNGFACNVCSDGISYPEKVMFNILTQLQIKFISQVSKSTPGFEWIDGNYLYDFYFEYNNNRFFLEMDGEFHKRNPFNNSYDIQKADAHKDKIANEHAINMIRIDCCYTSVSERFDIIKSNILKSILNDMFDLSIINWDMVQKVASNSKIKMAAELWDNEKKGVTEISKILNVSSATVRNYLKIANTLNMCNYNPQEAEKRRRKNAANAASIKHSKPIALLVNNKIIGVFKSAQDLENKSIELFDTYISSANVAAACKQKNKTIRGYAVRHITNNEYTNYYMLFGNNNISYDYNKQDVIVYNTSSKPIAVFKNGIMIGIFKSISDLALHSLDIFGINMPREK